MDCVYITPVIFNHARLNANTPKWARVYKALNEERIQGIVLDESNNYFWFEHNQIHEAVSESVYSTIKDYLINNCNFKYLYN